MDSTKKNSNNIIIRSIYNMIFFSFLMTQFQLESSPFGSFFLRKIQIFIIFSLNLIGNFYLKVHIDYLFVLVLLHTIVSGVCVFFSFPHIFYHRLIILLFKIYEIFFSSSNLTSFFSLQTTYIQSV